MESVQPSPSQALARLESHHPLPQPGSGLGLHPGHHSASSSAALEHCPSQPTPTWDWLYPPVPLNSTIIEPDVLATDTVPLVYVMWQPGNTQSHVHKPAHHGMDGMTVGQRALGVGLTAANAVA